MKTIMGTALTALAIACSPCPGRATTIYVDWQQTNNPPDGKSWATAWPTITNGVADMAASNAVIQGGHTVLVAAGTYNKTVTLSNSLHSGSNGAPNVIMSTNGATINRAGSCFLWATDPDYGPGYITIDGFNLTGWGGYGVQCQGNGGRPEIRIRNCNIYNKSSGGLFMAKAKNPCYIDHCNILFNGGHGLYSTETSVIYVRNCNIIGNANAGTYEFRSSANIRAAYCNYFANGFGNFWNYQGTGDGAGVPLNTAAEINGLSGNSNNIVSNPGFSDLRNWNFNQAYANSPLLNAGESGSDIGPHQNPPTVALSNATYYVATTGDDNRTAADAQNPSTPWATISNAANYAAAGDTVVVAAGTYTGQVTITKGGSGDMMVTYRADSNAVINASGSSNGLCVDRAMGVAIDGFEIRSPSSDGIFLVSSPTNVLRNLSVHNAGRYGVYFNMSSLGFLTASSVYSNSSYGIACQYASHITIDKSEILRNGGTGYANYDGQNGAAYYIKFQNCHIRENTGSGIYPAKYTSTFLKNCNIYNNTNDGIYMYEIADITLTNCNIVSNRYGGYEYRATGEINFRNCNVYGNRSGNLWDYTGPASGDGTNLMTAEQINNATPANSCTNNIVADPLFLNPPSNFRLAPVSPCVDAGTPTSDLPTDLYGNKRVFGRACDIGSFEYSWKGTFIRIGF